MKNLFEFATKELSQDAFLRWLFENYDCENKDVRKVAYKLLNSFTKLELQDGDICNLKTYSQFYKIDVVISFEYNDKVYIIAIEDKTFSREHNQLKAYNEVLNEKLCELNPDEKEYFVNKIFYKIDIPSDEDIKACEEAKWEYYFIEDIYNLFSEVCYTQNDILEDYKKHISFTRTRVNNISEKSMQEWDKLEFRTYFIKDIIKYINEKYGKEYWIKNGFLDGWHSYVSIVLKKQFQNTKYGMSLEIVARPSQGYFTILIRAIKIEENMEKEVSYKIRKILHNIISLKNNQKYINLKNTTSKSSNKKVWAIASGAKKLNEALKYEKSYEDITKKLKLIIDWYASLFDDNYCNLLKQ